MNVKGRRSALINSAVFLLALVYLATCILALLLLRRNRELASKLWGPAESLPSGLRWPCSCSSQCHRPPGSKAWPCSEWESRYTRSSTPQGLKELWEAFYSRENLER